MLQYHHCRNLNGVVYGEVRGHPGYYDQYFRDAYLWLENEVGFCPLFLAVGVANEDIRMTGYQNQWARLLSKGPDGNIYRKRGGFPNDVLFSFETIDGVFMDYDAWHLALNADYKQHHMTDYERRLIFKPSWSKARWLRRAHEHPHSVQLVTSSLYLPNAKRLWVRNKTTEALLTSMGFTNIEVRRLLME